MTTNQNDIDFTAYDYEIEAEDLNLDLDEIEALFDTNDIVADPEYDKINQNCFCKPRLHKRVKTVTFKEAIEAAKVLAPFIARGERIYGYVSGVFIWGSFIESLLLIMQKPVKELTISTLGLNIPNIISMRDLLKEGLVQRLNLIVSDSFFTGEHRRGDQRQARLDKIKRSKGKFRPKAKDLNLVEEIYHELGSLENFHFAACGIHAKTILIELQDGQKIVLSGSANLRSSRNLEQFDIETNDGLYDFNKKYLDRILHYFAIEKKSLRSNELFDKITEGELGHVEEAENSYLR